MKSSVSTVWFVGIVITFLLVFSAYIIITVDYSKSFKLKNEVINIIEKNKGMTLYAGSPSSNPDCQSSYNTPCLVQSTVNGSGNVVTHIGAIKTINAFLSASSYNAKGTCNVPSGHIVYGVSELKFGPTDTWSSIGEEAKADKHYLYCFAKYPTGRADREAYESVYYSVELFYKFEIPVIRELISVRVDGVTDEIYRPAEGDEPGIARNSKDYFGEVIT